MSSKFPAIELQQSSVFYNGKSVLENLNVSIQDRLITAVIGPSGTGKTTLLRTLSRLNDRIPGFRVTGRVRIHGQEIYDPGTDVYRLRQKVGMVFQSPCVFPKSIFDNVVFGLKHLQPRRKKEFPGLAESVLRKVNLWEEVKDRLHKPAPTLSLGQQQRLATARTLAINPEILLMDEPTSSLDPKSSQAMEELIQSLKGEHTVVLVTHNLSQARRIADDMIFLFKGKVWETGKTEVLFRNCVRSETREYLGGRDLANF